MNSDLINTTAVIASSSRRTFTLGAMKRGMNRIVCNLKNKVNTYVHPDTPKVAIAAAYEGTSVGVELYDKDGNLIQEAIPVENHRMNDIWFNSTGPLNEEVRPDPLDVRIWNGVYDLRSTEYYANNQLRVRRIVFDDEEDMNEVHNKFNDMLIAICVIVFLMVMALVCYCS